MEILKCFGTGFYSGQMDNGDAEVRFSKNHKNLNLYAPISTEVYASADGEIYQY